MNLIKADQNVIFFLFGLHFRKMSVPWQTEKSVQNKFMQSWEYGVAKEVPKFTKHLYTCICMCVTKESLTLALVRGVATIRPLSCKQMQILKHEKPTTPNSNVVFSRPSRAQLL